MSPRAAAQQRNSFVSNLAASAFSASFAEACTIPIDTAKVRLQLQASATGPPKYKGMMGTMMTVAREEGVGALWKGITPGASSRATPRPRARVPPPPPRRLGRPSSSILSPNDRDPRALVLPRLSLLRRGPHPLAPLPRRTLTLAPRSPAGIHRQILFGGLRIGLYEPIKNLYVGEDHEGDVPLHLKIAAGLTTGGLGIAVASPTDLVKVRMQAEGKLPAGVPRKYPSAMAAYGIIAKQEGVAALWTGLTPNVARNSVINAAELASYDQVKSSLMAAGMEDGVLTHLLSGLGAGFVACCVGSPVDVVKSRVMGDSAGKYKGFVDCVAQTLKSEGPGAFYKGFIPNFGRLGSWNVVMFLTLEQVKKAMRENGV
jgi:solute carrier family 25 uncoupling protein 8/9